MTKVIMGLFVLFASINLYTQGENAYIPLKLRRISKSLLMPLLALAYISATLSFKESTPNYYIVIALIMSWIGDVWLMGKVRQHEQGYLVELNDTRFLLGLVFFFVGHVFYAMEFMTHIALSTLPTPIYAFLLLLLWYGIIVFKGVNPKGAIRVGMIFYMFAIGSMIFSSLCMFVQNLDFSSFMMVVGAILFGSSDSVLGFQCIKKVDTLPDSYIMFSYISGQMFLVLGAYLMNF